jgi:hypothetical protein
MAITGATALTYLSAAGAAVSTIAAIKTLTAKKPESAADQQAAVDAKATQNSNARIAMRKKAMQSNSLLTGGGASAEQEPGAGILSGGKPTLGGG